MGSDLNSVPTSPRLRIASATAAQSNNALSPTSSRRPSQVMAPPTIPYSPTLQAGGPPQITGDQGNVATGPGPLRHPKPLTASDLHLMLEKEQEAMVNRLSRELTVLRQQTASVASTTSSTSTTFNDSIDALHSPYMAGPIHPTASRRHRSSSSLSSYIPSVQGSRTGGIVGIAPSRESNIRPSADLSRSGRSREPSITSRPPENPSQALSSSLHQQADYPVHSAAGSHAHSQRNLHSQQGVSPVVPLSRYEEIAQQRGELETIKRENEALRKRVRDLELTLKKYRERDSSSTEEAAHGSGISALTNELRNASIAGTTEG